MEALPDAAALEGRGKSAALGVFVRHLVHEILAVDAALSAGGAAAVAGNVDRVARAHGPVSRNGEAQLDRAVVGPVQLRAELDRRILYAGGPAVHALHVCPAAHLAGDVAVLVRVGVVEGPAGVGPGKGSGPAQAPTDDVRAVEGPHRPLGLVRLPVVDPQPPGVHLEHQAVVLAQCIVVAAVRSVLFVALDVVVLGVIGEAQAVARRDGLTDALDGGVLPCHLPVCLAEIAVARLAHAAEL